MFTPLFCQVTFFSDQEEDSVEMQNLPLTVPYLTVLGTMTLEESLTEQKRSNCLHSGRDEWDRLTRAI